MPSPTEATKTTKTTLIAYLEAEKVAAAARMRQVLCLLFLLDRSPMNSLNQAGVKPGSINFDFATFQCETFLASIVPLTDGEDDNDVRECLRSIAGNAEEDFGTTLHLLTVLKSRTTANNKSDDAIGDHSLNWYMLYTHYVFSTGDIVIFP